MSEIEINTTRQTEAVVDETACNIIMQAEAWFNSRKDQLTELMGRAQNENTSLQVGNIEIKEEAMKIGFALGLHAALKVFGNWPISINDNNNDED